MAQRMDICEKIYRELRNKRNNKFAYIFYEPVANLNLPDYDQIIKKPMDLDTIRAKLDRGAYNTTDEFAEDLRLCISNCRLYNPPDDPVIVMANQFERLVEQQLKLLETAKEEETHVDNARFDYERHQCRAKKCLNYAMRSLHCRMRSC